MNLKRNVVVFTILICIFFSISCVAASDVNDTKIATYENQVIGDASEEVISSPQEDPISSGEDDLIANSQQDSISNSALGTFAELQTMIALAPDGATITLEKDYTYNNELNLTQGVIIAKNLTINGNGHSLDGLSKTRILFIILNSEGSHKVTLNNIVFKNGNTRLYGGAILNIADLTVNNCVFDNNYADTTAGAICSIGSLNCKNSKFTNNVANGDAGAIFSLTFERGVSYFSEYYEKFSILNITDIDIRGTISDLINDFTLNPSTDYISNCKFSNNVAKGRGGGAIYAYSHINIVSSTFTSNKAKQVGGAVYAAKNLVVKNSKFTKNKVAVYGGAIYFKFHELSGYYDKNGKWKSDVKFYTSTIEKCVFQENVAKDRGGAIYGFKYSEKPKVSATKAVKCTFINNFADEGNEVYGGTYNNCVFKNTLTLKTVKVKKSAKSLVLTAQLKSGSKVVKNKKITFKFNGKEYTAKTNSKGVAKVTIKAAVLKKLKVGSNIYYEANYSKYHVKKPATVVK